MICNCLIQALRESTKYSEVEPILTYSNHWIGNDGFSLAIDRFLQEERVHVESYRDEARGLLPFRQED